MIVLIEEERIMESEETKVIKKMLNAIGKPVAFKYPGKDEQKKGVLKDRVVMKSNPDRMIGMVVCILELYKS